MTSAIERLRALLDERGVEWYEPTMKPNTTWFPDAYGINCRVKPWGDALCVKRYDLTPEQAVEATLGRGYEPPLAAHWDGDTLTLTIPRDPSCIRVQRSAEQPCKVYADESKVIAATLGSCNCSNSERTETCRLDGFADVPFSVDYEIEGYDMGSSRDYATLAECSSCGAYVIVPPEYHHVLTCDGDEVYQPYRFCPACGRRIEVDE